VDRVTEMTRLLLLETAIFTLDSAVISRITSDK